MGAAGAASGGSLAAAWEFCTQTHEISFEIIARTPPAPGETVTLAPGNPPALVNGGGPIGVLGGSDADAMNGCLALDWSMSGTVTSVDLARNKGVATIAGGR